MTNAELLQLDPQHLEELRSFCSGFRFEDVEVVAREEAVPDGTFEPCTRDFAGTAKALKFDGIFRGKNRMHAVFFGGEDDIFYCFSYATVGDIQERIIFKLRR